MASSLFSSSARKISTSVVRRTFAHSDNQKVQVLPYLKKQIEHAEHHAPAAAKRWEIISYWISLPILIALSAKIYMDETSHPHPRPEFKKYEYLHIRRNKFPWGDGQKSLFFNPHTNVTPDGYVDVDE